jgi:cell division protease FtsH
MLKFLFIFFTLINSSYSLINPLNNNIYNNLLKKNKFIVNYIPNYNLEEENYNNLIKDILSNKVENLYIDKNYKEIISYNSGEYFHTTIDPIIVPNLIQKASDLNIPIEFHNINFNIFTFFKNILTDLINFSSYIIIGIFIFSALQSLYQFNNIKQSGNSQNRNILQNLMPFKNNNEKFFKPNVSLESWAGSPEVIEECREVISYIENKDLFKEIGADMPKGILFEGPPGTGKTLLAKAIATASNSTFISISGSEFVELFVGMGASKVRDLFNTARQNRPSIIFIDEIDAVGRQRGAGVNMANDEREQTLNQLLYEMDGFNNNTDLIILGATNRKDVLDQALLRPGRFDRVIRIPLPDVESREKILDYYLKKKYINKLDDIKMIAEMTEGFSGAQLKNLLNEAAIISAKNNNSFISENYLLEAYEKSIVGLIKKNTTVSEITQMRVSIHEAGHSLLAIIFYEYFDFKKASIKPTYNGAGGYTLFSEKKDIVNSGLYTKDILKKRLIVTLGGKAAEYLFYGNEFVSLGANEDLSQANKLAQQMIGNFGMGDKLEVFFNENVKNEANPFLGRTLALGDKYSEYTKSVMDKESLKLVNDAYIEAKRILEENYELLIKFSQVLKENVIITKDDINYLKILNGTQILDLP